MWQDQGNNGWGSGGSNRQVVTIPFTECLEADSHTCKIHFPATIGRDKAERQFFLDYACLVPEYYSKQAVEYKMDPDIDDVQHVIQVEHKFKEKVATPEPWVMPSKKMDMSAVIQSLNTYFDRNKPTGCKYPLVFFDWVHLDQELSNMPPKKFYDSTVNLYYDTVPSSLSEVQNTMPASLNDLPIFVNQMKYPDDNSQIIFEKVRIRMHVLSNASAAFSNEILLEAMGFDVSTQIGMRLAKQYKVFGNRKHKAIKTVVALKGSKLKVEEATTGSIKVYFHQDILEGTSNQAIVKSSMAKWNRAENIVSDVNAVLLPLLKQSNLDASLVYEDGQFGINFDGKEKINLTVMMDENLSKKLGFKGEKRVTPNSPRIKVSFEENISDIEAKSRTLVYDTRVVFVQLEDNAGYTGGAGEEVLATLLPVYDGTMTTYASRYKSYIQVTALDKYIELGLYRYSESKESIPLGWKVKAYFTGQLVGI